MANSLIGGYNFAISTDGQNWTFFKAKEIKEGFESLASEDSGRTLDGVMHIYWVRRKLRKVEVVMPPQTSANLNTLTNLVQGQEYYFRFWSLNGGDTTFHAYTSNAAADMYSGVVHNGLWEGFEFHAIEL